MPMRCGAAAFSMVTHQNLHTYVHTNVQEAYVAQTITRPLSFGLAFFLVHKQELIAWFWRNHLQVIFCLQYINTTFLPQAINTLSHLCDICKAHVFNKICYVSFYVTQSAKKGLIAFLIACTWQPITSIVIEVAS